MTRARRTHLAVLSASALVLAVAAIVGIQWATPASAQSLTPVAFQLNFTAGGYNAGFALALQEGLYKKSGLDVTIIKGQGSGVTAQLVASGKADIAYADALAVMQLIAKGAPMKIVSTIYQSNPNAVTVLTTSGIKSIAELKGRSVAVPTGQSQTAMVPILFKANGLAESDVNLVNMPGNAMIASLLQKQVDAMLGSLDNYDLIFRQRGVDILSLPFADHGVATVSTSIIASDAALAQRGDIVRKFIQASLEGWDAAIKRPDDAIKALVQTFPTDTEPPRNLGELKAAISLMCKNGAKFVGKAEAEAWTRTVSVAQQVLGLPTSVPASAYYTHEFLPAALPDEVPARIGARRAPTASRMASERGVAIDIDRVTKAFPIDGQAGDPGPDRDLAAHPAGRVRERRRTERLRQEHPHAHDGRAARPDDRRDPGGRRGARGAADGRRDRLPGRPLARVPKGARQRAAAGAHPAPRPARGARPARSSCWSSSAWPMPPTDTRGSFRGACASACRSRAPWSTGPPCS